MMLAIGALGCAGVRSQAEPVEIRGVARDAKGGAVVVADDGRVIYLEGLDSWPPHLHGQKVTVSGTLRQKKYLPDPVVGAAGEISQGAEGDQLVLEAPTWRLTNGPKPTR